VKAFRFRAARVLDWRMAAANTAHGAFVRARESAREAADLVQAADTRCNDAADTLRAHLASPVDAETVVRHRTWIDHQRAAVVACQRQYDERAEAAAAAATVLHAAQRQVKVLERLRERGRRRHMAAEQRDERKRLDEFAVQQFARSRMHGETDYGR
jgi:flagellar export protein FliJ